MATAIVSDLHLGGAAGADIARRPEVLERLVGALEGVERLVLLGDVLELRERRIGAALELARPVFEALGGALAGGSVVLLVGNHDHELADPWLARLGLDGKELGVAESWRVTPGQDAPARIAGWMPDVEMTLAYPGVWLRDDVYATHGHYLDMHLTLPRLESLAAGVMRRTVLRSRELSAPALYEAGLTPIYDFLYALAQGASEEALLRGGSFSRSVWSSVSEGRGGALRRLLLGRVTIPGAVALLNRAGLGPFSPDLSGEELRRSGLRGMGAVVDRLGIEAEHVIFGHTHRPGPLPGDDPGEWRAPGGARLWNTGSWLYEPALLGAGRGSPYWPGRLTRLDETGPPRLESLLAETELAPPPGLG